MFFSIALRCFSIRILLVVVPTGGCSTYNESIGLDQEHESPEKEDYVEDEQYLQPRGDMEMSERILMRNVVRWT